jgi:hypothetical protein
MTRESWITCPCGCEDPDALKDEAYGQRMLYERRIKELVETLLFAKEHLPFELRPVHKRIRETLAEEARW